MKRVAALFALALVAAAPASAADFTFSGNFRQDNDVLRFDFTIATDRTVGVRSSSWQGPRGGFDPILTISDSAGNIITDQDDGDETGTFTVNGIDYDHGVFDSFFDVSLVAGAYSAVITQFDNFALGPNLSDGFEQDGNPNFTLGFGNAAQPMFNGTFTFPDPDPRTSFWRIHLLNVDNVIVVDPNPVPAPGGLALFGLALAGLLAARRRA